MRKPRTSRSGKATAACRRCRSTRSSAASIASAISIAPSCPATLTPPGAGKTSTAPIYQDVRLPPVQLYKVGDVYFVKDGNHRVSVAREHGVEFIDAEVIESHVRVPIVRLDDAVRSCLMQVEYAEFLRLTNLDRLRPEHDIRPSALGRYDEIWDHILVRQLEMSDAQGRDVPISEAVASWYDDIYQPIVQIARERGVPRRFPDRLGDRYLSLGHGPPGCPYGARGSRGRAGRRGAESGR